MQDVHRVLVGFTSFLFIGCLAIDDGATTTAAGLTAAATLEGFESGSKGSYAAGDVALATGTWRLDDALIGGLAGDVKDGAHAARVRNAGRLTMLFDRAS